jgi:hypothetical protein
MNLPSGAGYHDYEDIGLIIHDLDNCEVITLSDCCDRKVTPISGRCTKCLRQCDVYTKLIELDY